MLQFETMLITLRNPLLNSRSLSADSGVAPYIPLPDHLPDPRRQGREYGGVSPSSRNHQTRAPLDWKADLWHATATKQEVYVQGATQVHLQLQGAGQPGNQGQELHLQQGVLC